MVDPVQTVMAYQPNREDDGTFKLFAATDADIFDVTASSAAPTSVRTLSGAAGFGRMSYTMLTNIAGAFLLACSHEGGYLYYDGTAWAAVPSSGTNSITGIAPADLVFVTTWKRRVWFIEKDSTSAWYSDVDSPFGALTEFDLGPFAKRGGKLAFISNWTIDAGEGIDDLIVFGFENGDVLIYKGTDPDSITTFALQGAYYVGAMPVGRRCFAALGGDLLILSEMGLQPISYVTRGGQSLLRAGSTDYLGKIQPRIADLVAELGTTIGWDMILYPRDNLFVIQKPGTSTYQQYALYTNTNTWTTFENIPMVCSTVANSQFYFGTDDGRVCVGFTGFFDGVEREEIIGAGIQGLIQPSYSYFGRPGMNKHFLMARPTFQAVDRPTVSCQVLADYRFVPNSGSLIYDTPDSSIWDVAIWDAAVWAGALNVYDDWLGVEALGYTGSAYLTTVCVGDTFLSSIDYMVEPGGPI
jgi:hypothetical protein